MFTQREIELIRNLSSSDASSEVTPERLRNHPLILIAQILESGRSQRFFDSDPYSAPEHSPEQIINAVKELRWEGFVDVDVEDLDGDGIPETVLETGWSTNDSGIEFLRRIKDAAGLD